MSKIAVVYYSATGHIYDMAEAVVKGAKDAGAEVRLRHCAVELELDVAQFDRDPVSATVIRRIGRDVESGLASGESRVPRPCSSTGVVHLGAYDAVSLLEALAR